MSKVYVCTGSCHGQATEPGVCQADSCERKGQPLEPLVRPTADPAPDAMHPTPEDGSV